MTTTDPGEIFIPGKEISEEEPPLYFPKIKNLFFEAICAASAFVVL